MELKSGDRRVDSLGVRRLVLTAAVTAALAGAGGALVANSAPAASQTAAGLLNSALHDAAARGSVHETESGGPTGHPPTLTGSSDITNTGGTEVVHIARLGDADVMLIGSQAYLRSTRAALTQLYKFPATAAGQAAGRWVSFARSTSSNFLNLVDGLTLPSALYDVTPQGALTQTAPTKIDGQAVIGIRGKAPASYGFPTLTLYVSRSASPVPVAASYGGVKGTTAGDSFSRWGERVTLTPPTGAIPRTSLPG